MKSHASVCLLAALFASLGGVSSQTLQQKVSSIVEKLIVREREYYTQTCDDHSERNTFDFIVVGAGAAGAVLASRLSEGGKWTVLLLEAGDEESFIMDVPMLANPLANNPAVDWMYKKEPGDACPKGPQEQCNYPRGKVMGGTTTTGAMIYSRGGRACYDFWAQQGNDGWGYDDVLPYFRKWENMKIPELRDSPYHGTDGPMPITYAPYEPPISELVLQSAQELGIPQVDYNGASQAGVSRVQTYTLNGQRWSTNRAFLWREKPRRNLFVRKRSLVTRVLFDALNKRARGVRYERHNASFEVTAAREVILCAGAINTPQLLMLSGIGPRRHLQDLGISVRKDLPVGRKLIDRTLFIGLPLVFNESVAPIAKELFFDFNNYVDWINGTGELTTISTVDTIYYYKAGEPKFDSEPNFEMLMSEIPTQVPYGSNENIFQTLEDQYSTMPYVINFQPVSVGKVTLTSKDIHVQPKIFPNYFGEEVDVRNAVAGIKKLLEFFQTETFQRVGARVFDEKLPGCEEYEFASDDYWSCAVQRFSITDYNPCCTCSMGPKNDSSSVVDSHLRVKGYNNLRVVDTSVFPYIPSGELTAAVMMTAEKASDLIKNDHKGPSLPIPIPSIL